MWLERIREPADLRDLSYEDLEELAGEIRDFIVAAVAETGGHLGSNLGAVELTLALHRVFNSPVDAVLWDTGHQAYVHKLVTGRRNGFGDLRQSGGLSGYPSREESRHDYVENSHASTILSYAYGMAVARDAGVDPHRHIVAVIGDGSMTGGMAYEALNNLGHSKRRVIIVLNDNGRSYAPTISNLTAKRATAIGDDGPADTPPLISRIGDWLSHSLTEIRLNPTYVRRQRRLEEFLRDVPLVGTPAERAVEAFKAGVREFLQPPAFFEALGVRYVGPVDGHDVPALEHALRNAEELSAEGPIVVHVLTTKGRGYAPAEDDEEKHLHDAPVFDPLTGPPKAVPTGYTQAFAEAVIKEAEADSRVVAITAAMAGPTGLLPFQARFPERFFDVGIAEQHAVTAAAGMAMSGLRPIVAIYSTFLNRAWDQVVYDVALHRLPVVFCLDRAGLTGPDGPSHHGVYDMAMLARVPGMRVLAPSSAQELQAMLHDAMHLADAGPVAIRYPRGQARQVAEHEIGVGIRARRERAADDAAHAVCLLAVGKMLGTAVKAADRLAERGIAATVWDVRCCAPLDEAMLADAARHHRVVTVEDGIRDGGIGMHIAERLRSRSAADVVVLGLPCQFIPHHANPDHLLSQHGLDADGIAAAARA
jgi:1-deoxy-D-xylulose-5-phosphate synthase